MLHPVFEDNINSMIRNLGASKGEMSEDIVHHLRVATLLNSQVVMAGSQAQLEPGDFPHIVGEYNFLVVHAKFRVKSSELLFKLGESIKQEKGIQWTHNEINAEMAGQVLAATETTSSALAFIFYELAKNSSLQESVYNELSNAADNDNLENLKLLGACVSEGLRFRPPVALTGSRVVPNGGIDILGYYIPAGTVVTTQSLSMSRQRPDLFPNYDIFDPTRWLDEDQVAERRRLTAPFGVGARRCPGGYMATYQMRLIIAAVLREFKVSIAPETTPESMTPFEANGFRSRYDKCFLMFTPRGSPADDKA
ncbi:hypothetical protein INS49_006201 [Diaporthe citri]|uniref:uncharacterized protein n=1 Tax=Diaporthe citri TaxID=83186 RepID=UPI001C803475|nr:uncharacterized protein INS49_006201 [Diaporthe citri]KAG6364599.1 hypothetical protein INS49_006201 [Diaporthe citri]